MKQTGEILEYLLKTNVLDTQNQKIKSYVYYYKSFLSLSSFKFSQKLRKM